MMSIKHYDDKFALYNTYLKIRNIHSLISGSGLGYDYFVYLMDFMKAQDKKFIQNTLDIKPISFNRFIPIEFSRGSGPIGAKKIWSSEQVFEYILIGVEADDLMGAVKLSANKPRIIDSIDYCYSAIFDVISKANRLYYE